jgi:hypothetical protein
MCPSPACAISRRAAPLPPCAMADYEARGLAGVRHACALPTLRAALRALSRHTHTHTTDNGLHTHTFAINAWATQADEVDHGEAMEDDGEKLKSEVAAGKKQRARARTPTHLRARAHARGQFRVGARAASFLRARALSHRPVCPGFPARAGARLRGGHGRGPRLRRRFRGAGSRRRSRPRTLCAPPLSHTRTHPPLPPLRHALTPFPRARSGGGLDRDRARRARGGAGGRRARGVCGAR